MKVQCGEIRPKSSLPRDEELLDWFRRIVRNEARNRRRTERIRDCERLDEVEEAAAEHLADSDPLLEVIVAGVVSELAPAQRDVATLRLRGWRLVDIAIETKRAEGTMNRPWYRARGMLRMALRPCLDRWCQRADRESGDHF